MYTHGVSPVRRFLAMAALAVVLLAAPAQALAQSTSSTPNCQPADLTSDLPSGTTGLDTVEQAYNCLTANYGGATNVTAQLLADGAWQAARTASHSIQHEPPFSSNYPEAFQALATSLKSMTASFPPSSPSIGFIYRAAINGMAGSLHDDHTGYISAATFAGESQQLTGNTQEVGLGLHFLGDPSTNQVFVFSVTANGPASFAGVRPGDVLVALNGHSITSVQAGGSYSVNIIADSLNDFTSVPGLPIRLDINRPGTTTTMSLVVTAGPVVSPDVEGTVLPNGVGYIHIWTFSTTSASRTATLVGLEQSLNAKRFVIDVRGNPGGSVTSATRIASMFTHAPVLGMVISKTDQSIIASNKSVPLVGEPLSIIVDGGSASSSEFLSSALQDTKGATIVGAKSAGDIGAALFYVLSDGSALEITVAQVLRGGGQPIDRIGVTPDVLAQTTSAGLGAGHDAALDAAIANPGLLTPAPAPQPTPIGVPVVVSVPQATLWSGPDQHAVAFGTRPAGTKLLIVAPEVGTRYFVLDSVTNNYAWIDYADIELAPSNDSLALPQLSVRTELQTERDIQATFGL